MRVTVRNGDVAKAYKVLQRKMKEDRALRIAEEQMAYEKPSDKKRRLKRAAIRRSRKVKNGRK